MGTPASAEGRHLGFHRSETRIASASGLTASEKRGRDAPISFVKSMRPGGAFGISNRVISEHRHESSNLSPRKHCEQTTDNQRRELISKRLQLSPSAYARPHRRAPTENLILQLTSKRPP